MPPVFDFTDLLSSGQYMGLDLGEGTGPVALVQPNFFFFFFFLKIYNLLIS
jgi:hypothetical protein